MKSPFRLSPLMLLLVLFQTTPTLAHVFEEVWERAEYEQYGFSMVMPPDTYLAVTSSESEDGWVTLRGNMEGAFFLGLAGADIHASPAELDALRARLTDWPTMSWEALEEGEDSAGWKWYRTFRTGIHGDTFFGGYGVGTKGSYVFLVKTSDADFTTHRTDYASWFESITLDN